MMSVSGGAVCPIVSMEFRGVVECIIGESGHCKVMQDIIRTIAMNYFLDIAKIFLQTSVADFARTFSNVLLTKILHINCISSSHKVDAYFWLDWLKKSILSSAKSSKM